MKWALLSVWDKTGIVDLARSLAGQKFSIMSSGGTGKILAEAGIKFTEVASYTGFPEMMDGRVKTLHPKVHGGLLGRRPIDDSVMAKHGINRIDLLVVNLYPFEQMSARKLNLDELIEFIDVGGPAMIRAAAKNYQNVTVVVDPADYQKVAAGSCNRQHSRKQIASRLQRKRLHGQPRTMPRSATTSIRWSPRSRRHFPCSSPTGGCCGTGKIPTSSQPCTGQAGSRAPNRSRENRCRTIITSMSMPRPDFLREFEEPAAVIVKHNNPCGVSVGKDILAAYLSAREVDPVSAYGSVTAVNGEVDAGLAGELCSTFVEVIAAQSFSPDCTGDHEEEGEYEGARSSLAGCG